MLDDIRSLAPENEELWQHEVFVTAKEYDQDRLSALELPEEEFAAFGYMVLGRRAVRDGRRARSRDGPGR